MVKAEFLVIRADREFKERLEQVAQRRGQNMTAFVMDTLEKEMRRVETAPAPAPRTFRGVPSYFRGWCITAGQGGAMGYKEVGTQFAKALPAELEPQGDAEAVERKLDELRGYLDVGYSRRIDEARALAWFDREFPKCMALIPQRRRKQFIEGVAEYQHDEGIAL